MQKYIFQSNNRNLNELLLKTNLRSPSGRTMKGRKRFATFRPIDPPFHCNWIIKLFFFICYYQIKEESSKVLNTLVIIHAKVRTY